MGKAERRVAIEAEDSTTTMGLSAITPSLTVASSILLYLLCTVVGLGEPREECLVGMFMAQCYGQI